MRVIKNYFFIVLASVLLVFLTSCESGRTTSKTGSLNTDNSTIGDGDGDDGGDDETPPEEEVAIALHHIIDPFDGSYRYKVTIPKTYRGELYFSGPNLSSLNDSQLEVSISFGQSPYHEVRLPAVLTTTTSPTTGDLVQVIKVAVTGMDFSSVPLAYHLYDYNDYNFLDPLAPLSSTWDEPVTHNMHEKLYCRGLALSDDPTAINNCTGTGDECRYAYARVDDVGLYNATTGQFIYPQGASARQIDNSGIGYDLDGDQSRLLRCLPDDGGGVDAGSVVSIGDVLISFAGDNYEYQGPYQANDYSNWQITGDAIFGDKGLFLDRHFSAPLASDPNYGIRSLKFPLFTKIFLANQTQYLGVDPGEPASAAKSLQVLSAGVGQVNGETRYVDGCNARANTSSLMQESIDACNVAASVKLYRKQMGPQHVNESFKLVAYSQNLKIQLVPDDANFTTGNSVLGGAFQGCTQNSDCEEGCCVNNRCISDQIMGSCPNLPGSGMSNLALGQSCGSDFSCQSLCCQGGVCAPHDPGASPSIYCQKPIGQSCALGDEYCQFASVTQCLMVKTGPGVNDCDYRCYTNPAVHGRCISGTCAAPATPVNMVDERGITCENAVDIPHFSAIPMAI